MYKKTEHAGPPRCPQTGSYLAVPNRGVIRCSQMGCHYETTLSLFFLFLSAASHAPLTGCHCLLISCFLPRLRLAQVVPLVPAPTQLDPPPRKEGVPRVRLPTPNPGR